MNFLNIDLFIKYSVDKVLALILLIVLSPLFILISMILFFSKSNVFFVQERLGIKGKNFKIIKFCTMNNLRDNDDMLLADELRTTKIGKFLRLCSLDELPQLINILFGDMSFVGPRPLLAHYKNRYSAFQKQRHLVRPGLTGWAQINGRNLLDWEEKFVLDVWYVNHRSIWLDIKIFFFTLLKMIKKEGVNTSSNISMPEFMGKENE